MELISAILDRRSIRQYGEAILEKDKILELLDKAQWAPSACNRQGHKIIYITGTETKQRLVDLGAAPFLLTAPAVLVFLYEKTSDNIEYRDDIQSASALIQNFLLLAHEAKLAACWICHLPTKRALKELLNIPKGLEPIAAVTLGYGKQADLIARVPRKHAIRDVFFQECVPVEVKIQRPRYLRLKSFIRKVYLRLPLSIKKLVNPIVHKYFVKKF